MQFEWNDIFKTGIPIIDEQHKELFKIGGRINELWLQYDQDDQHEAIIKELNSLEKYATYHFQTEEALLEKYGFELTLEHKEMHKEFFEFVQKLKNNPDNKDDKEAISDMLRFIMKWIFKHINHEDSKYAEFILSKLK